MTPREAVTQALDHHEVRPVPYHIKLTKGAQEALTEHYGGRAVPDSWGCMAIRKIGADLTKEVSPGHFRDYFGVVWDRTVDRDIGLVPEPTLARPSLSSYTFPDPDDARLYARHAEWSGKAELYRVHEIPFALFERAWTLRGFAQLLMDLVEHPAFVEDLLDAIVEHNLRVMERSLAYDFEMYYFGDDYGSQRGLLMSPATWRRLFKPRLARFFEFAHRHGKKTGLHCCGRVQELLPDFIEIGLDLFNPFQPEVMDARETKRQYAGKIAFYGGISVQSLLPHGTPPEVEAQVCALLRDLGSGGGYIAAPSHRVPPDVPVENVEAMMRALDSQAAPAGAEGSQ